MTAGGHCSAYYNMLQLTVWSNKYYKPGTSSLAILQSTNWESIFMVFLPYFVSDFLSHHYYWSSLISEFLFSFGHYLYWCRSNNTQFCVFFFYVNNWLHGLVLCLSGWVELLDRCQHPNLPCYLITIYQPRAHHLTPSTSIVTSLMQGPVWDLCLGTSLLVAE